MGLGIGPREGVLLGANLGPAIVTNGDFTAYVCDSTATRPSSQITVGRLVIAILLVQLLTIFEQREFGMQQCANSTVRNGNGKSSQNSNKSSSGDEIPERDVTYIILSVYLLTTEL